MKLFKALLLSALAAGASGQESIDTYLRDGFEITINRFFLVSKLQRAFQMDSVPRIHYNSLEIVDDNVANIAVRYRFDLIVGTDLIEACSVSVYFPENGNPNYGRTVFFNGCEIAFFNDNILTSTSFPKGDMVRIRAVEEVDGIDVYDRGYLRVTVSRSAIGRRLLAAFEIDSAPIIHYKSVGINNNNTTMEYRFDVEFMFRDTWYFVEDCSLDVSLHILEDGTPSVGRSLVLDGCGNNTIHFSLSEFGREGAVSVERRRDGPIIVPRRR